MRSFKFWDNHIACEAERLGFQERYKILYGPWDTIGSADTVFLSLNPGRPPECADLFTLSDERGNSYEVERDITVSPITQQFLKLADLLELQPIQILTGAIAPFRSSKRWKGIPLTQRKAALDIGRTFWEEVFATKRPTKVICCCPDAGKIVSGVWGPR